MNFDFLPNDKTLRDLFQENCQKLNIPLEQRKLISELVIYSLCDGTRTSSELSGIEAYADGSMFVLRLLYFLKCLGAETAYILTFAEGHDARDNYDEIVEGTFKNADIYKQFINTFDIGLKFIGKLGSIQTSQTPNKEFISKLNEVESSSKDNTSFTGHILINYSAKWAYEDTNFKELPNANVIVQYTKGVINEGLWLPDKLHGNSMVYVQNGSLSQNWNDTELVYLIAIALKSYIMRKGYAYSKSYVANEKEVIREKREDELYLLHEKLQDKPKKRSLIFSPFGPEIYDF